MVLWYSSLFEAGHFWADTIPVLTFKKTNACNFQPTVYYLIIIIWWNLCIVQKALKWKQTSTFHCNFFALYINYLCCSTEVEEKLGSCNELIQSQGFPEHTFLKGFTYEHSRLELMRQCSFCKDSRKVLYNNKRNLHLAMPSMKSIKQVNKYQYGNAECVEKVYKT